MRNWLLTWRTYGTWLPGDERGFISKHHISGEAVIHNVPGKRMDGRMELLNAHAASLLKCAPVTLTSEQATVLQEQFEETVLHRRWRIHAGAVLVNHVHLAISAPDIVKPDRVLQDLKAYGSRALNARWRSAKWWATGGSRRHVVEENLPAAIDYVLQQERSLVVWRA